MEVIPNLAALGSSDTGASQTKKAFGELDQADFLRLLTTQLRYQDPTAPTDPQEFMQQLVQFSSVDSLQNLQKTVSDAFASIDSTRLLQSTSLVNKQVLASTSAAAFTGSPLSGGLLVPESSASVRVRVANAAGAPIRTIELGPGEGQLNFQWDGKNDVGQMAPAGTYYFQGEGEYDSGARALETLLVAEVASVSVVPGVGKIQVQLATGETIPIENIFSVF